jgi:hypothetical protein
VLPDEAGELLGDPADLEKTDERPLRLSGFFGSFEFHEAARQSIHRFPMNLIY